MGVKEAKNAAAFAAKNESQLQNERLAHLVERSEHLQEKRKATQELLNIQRKKVRDREVHSNKMIDAMNNLARSVQRANMTEEEIEMNREAELKRLENEKIEQEIRFEENKLRLMKLRMESKE